MTKRDYGGYVVILVNYMNRYNSIFMNNTIICLELIAAKETKTIKIVH